MKNKKAAKQVKQIKEIAQIKEKKIQPEELDAVIEAGEVLMGSGAEIYRIEGTMKHMATALGIRDFNGYVLSKGIIVAGTDAEGEQESRLATVPETAVDLGRIEAVNALSREVEQRHDLSVERIMARLQEIKSSAAPRLWRILLAYFVGAGCFSYAIGSTPRDSLCSAVIGLILGLGLQGARKFIRTKVLLTIVGSGVVTIFANLACICGLGEHRKLIILGTLMLLVPGAAFVNSVREFSQNNHTTGFSLLMSALLTCLSLAFGMLLASEFIPFVERMDAGFSTEVASLSEMLLRTVMAGVGTVAFSFLFHAPKKYFPDLGCLGAASWMLYQIAGSVLHMGSFTIFLPALFASLASRFLSVRRKCPITIFLSTSIFPLLPGLSLYRAVYFLMIGSPEQAWSYLQSCFITGFSIALSIIITQEIRTRRK